MKTLPIAHTLDRFLWCHHIDEDPNLIESKLHILHTKSPMMLMQLYYLDDKTRYLHLTESDMCGVGTQLEYEDTSTQQFVVRTIILYEEAPKEEIKKVVEDAITWYLGDLDEALRVSTMAI